MSELDQGNEWFIRDREGITTSTKNKKEVPEGLWHKCNKCMVVIPTEELAKNKWVCPTCEKHERIGSAEYFSIIFDEGKFTEFSEKLTSADPLKFTDSKTYPERIKGIQKKTGLTDAIRTAHGPINGTTIVIAAMDFSFIGGSMGSVVGEKISRAVDKAIELKAPFMIISKSGGARMMEAGISLMQLAKTSAKLAQLSEAKLPYISFLTDPTTGGVTASFAMLGDVNIAEPDALIAFAGPRIVRDTVGKDLPAGFQRSEFVLEHGFLDFIVDRRELKAKLTQLIKMLSN
jgi:acetyl-CoA carboxylase carboxyl transferase subunit beta